MKKLTLLGINHKTGRLEVYIEKSKKLHSVLAKILLDFGFAANPYLLDEEEELKPFKFVDTVENYNSNKLDIDLIYGYKKLIFIVRSKSEENIEYFKKAIFNFFEFKSK
jgi:hypothetical protein